MLRHLDLFSGIGGFALAAQWAGFTTVGFAEIEPFACKVLKKHWPKIPNFGNVRSVPNMSNITLITGGFPCQPFSQAGKKRGIQDERYLWPEFYRIIKANKPHFVVAENVVGSVAMVLNDILDDLESAGYETSSFIIPASAVTAPHRRERLWIIAHMRSQRRNYGIDSASQCQIYDNWQRDLTATKAQWAKYIPSILVDF